MTPRVVITFEVGGPVTADTLSVENAEDVALLKRDLRERQVLDEVRFALGELWDELAILAREAP